MRNLRIEELSIGAWVQRFLIDEGYTTSPLMVSHIDIDGYVWAVGKDGEVKATVSGFSPIPIDERILEGFGFVRTKGDDVWLKRAADMRLTVALRYRGGVQQCRRCAISGKIACWNEEIRYLHELQRWWNDRVLFPFGISLDMEWRGIKEKKEELV